MRVAITQSNYIPWKGYFDIIRGVDEFVLYDGVQSIRFISKYEESYWNSIVSMS